MTDGDFASLPSTPLTAISKEDFATFATKLDEQAVLHHILHCHEQALRSFGYGLQWGFTCGLFLVWMKDHVLEHGEFVNWVRTNCPFDIRQAQRYTRLVRKWDEICSKATSEDAFPTNSVAGLLEYVKEEAQPNTDDSSPIGESAPVEADATESESDSRETPRDTTESGLAPATNTSADSPPLPSLPKSKSKPKEGSTKDQKAKEARGSSGTPQESGERNVICTIQLTILPTEPLTADVLFNRLRMGKAEFRGQIWEASSKTLPVTPGGPMPKGCLAEVTSIVVRHIEEAGSAATAPPPTDEPTKSQPPPKQSSRRRKNGAKGTITIKGLTSQYGEHAVTVLQDHLEERPRKKGGMRTYKIVKPLPTDAEFQELQKTTFTSTVGDLVASAFADLDELASEVGDIFDNMNEGLQNTNRGNMLEEARGTLDNLSQPDVPEAVATKEVLYLPILNARSRAARRDDAVGRLEAVVEALDVDTDNEEVKELVDELQNAIGETEGVEFPGMYG